MATVDQLRSKLYKTRKKALKRGKTLSGYKFSPGLPLVEYKRAPRKAVHKMRKTELIRELNFLEEHLQKETLKYVQQEWSKLRRSLKNTVDPFNKKYKPSDDELLDFRDRLENMGDDDTFYEVVESFIEDNYFV